MTMFFDKPRIGHRGKCRRGLCQEAPTSFLGDWSGWAGYCDDHKPTEREAEAMYDDYIRRKRETERSLRFTERS